MNDHAEGPGHHHGGVLLADPPADGTSQRVKGQHLWLAHNSGRFDRPAAAWCQALAFLRTRSVMITGTEAAGRSHDLFERAHEGTEWTYAHLAGAAEGECYASWDTSILEPLGKATSHKLTDITWFRSREYGGGQAAKVHALVVPLGEVRGSRRWWFVVVHMPLDNTPTRAAAWVDCCRGLIDLKADLASQDPEAVVVVVGDFNKNLREADELAQVRHHLTEPLAAVTSWSRGLPEAGTHHKQLIDYAILPGPSLVDGELVRDLADSDHRGFRYLV